MLSDIEALETNETLNLTTINNFNDLKTYININNCISIN